MNVIPEIIWLGFVIVTVFNPNNGSTGWTNAFERILVTEGGIVIDVKEHNRNAREPILINNGLVGSVTDAKRVQPLNALVPILVTEFGIVIDANNSHPWNTLVPILVNDGLVGSVTDTKESQFLNAS